VKSTWRDGDRMREVELTALAPGRWRARVDDATFELTAEPMADGKLRLVSDAGTMVAEVTAVGGRRFVRLGTLDFVLERETSGGRSVAGGARGTHAERGSGLTAPMPGTITKVMVVVGDEVTKGQPLVALEAMKMEHLIRAPHDGVVKRVAASPGTMVQSGAELVELEAK
jgi:3-methylcrotonyl-CoA carboxylase alpha subunit